VLSDGLPRDRLVESISFDAKIALRQPFISVQLSRLGSFDAKIAVLLIGIVLLTASVPRALSDEVRWAT